MNLKFDVKKLMLVNSLVQGTGKENSVKKYVIELIKKDKALYVECAQEYGKFAVCLKMSDSKITNDAELFIENASEFGEILSSIIDSSEIEIEIKKNSMTLFGGNKATNNIELPFYQETPDELERRTNLKNAFKQRKYGNKTTLLNYYEMKDPNDKEPDAICTIIPKELMLNKLKQVFKGNIMLTVKEETLMASIGVDKNNKQAKNITRAITKKDEKDPTEIKGQCEVLLQDISSIIMLSGYDGTIDLEIKKDFPMVIKKKFIEEKIGVNYIVSLMVESEEPTK